MPQIGQHGVGRRRQIGDGVEQGAVEIEAERPDQGQTGLQGRRERSIHVEQTEIRRGSQSTPSTHRQGERHVSAGPERTEGEACPPEHGKARDPQKSVVSL